MSLPVSNAPASGEETSGEGGNKEKLPFRLLVEYWMAKALLAALGKLPHPVARAGCQVLAA
ncbi:MAG: hypothetical protein ACRD3O_16070, partial [Terriglobia bacterium]